jgi:hypothetical protein
MALGVQTDMATPALARWGTDDLKKEFLAPAIAGEVVCSIAVSEASGGSDVAAIKTQAKKDGSDYVINGSKMWITNAAQADWLCTLVNTGDGPVHMNKTLVIIPTKTKGVTIGPKIDKLGMRASDTCPVFFDNVRVPQRHRIGEEGMGFMMQMVQFQEERLCGAIGTLRGMESLIAAPTVYVLPSNRAIGVGYAENDLFGENRKVLLYGQLGNHTSMFFGTYLIPYVRGTPLQLRFDLYLLDHDIDEYANPPSDPTEFSIARTSTEHFLDAGALVGWQFNWWFSIDARLRGAYVYFNQIKGGPRPEADGRDVTLQSHITADVRHHLFGVTWGPYVQLIAESSLPKLDTYGYQLFQLRAYYS